MKRQEIAELPAVDAQPAWSAAHGLPAEQRLQRRLRHECEVRITRRRAGQNEEDDQIDSAAAATLLAFKMTIEVVTDIDEPVIGGDGEKEGERIIGSGDRAHHLALVAGHGAPAPGVPVPSASAREPLVVPLRAKSRAECRRRCDRGGRCDPSSDLGCGGEYCNNPGFDAAQEF